jgi:hypothetical protein
MAQDNSTGPDVRYLPKWRWRARLGEFAAAKAKRRLTPAGELGTADAVGGFAPKFHTEGNRISSAQRQLVTILRYGTNRRKVRNMIGENHGRKD